MKLVKEMQRQFSSVCEMSAFCESYLSHRGCLAPLGNSRGNGSIYGCCLGWGWGSTRASLCLISKSAFRYCFSPPQSVTAGWTDDGESALFVHQLSKCTLWCLHKFPDLCLGDILHMSQPYSLWSLHHLFLNFQYIFSSSSKGCKELDATLKQEGNYLLIKS